MSTIVEFKPFNEERIKNHVRSILGSDIEIKEIKIPEKAWKASRITNRLYLYSIEYQRNNGEKGEIRLLQKRYLLPSDYDEDLEIRLMQSLYRRVYHYTKDDYGKDGCHIPYVFAYAPSRNSLLREFIEGYSLKEKVNSLDDRITAYEKDFGKAEDNKKEDLLKKIQNLKFNRENYIMAQMRILGDLHSKGGNIQRKLFKELRILSENDYADNYIKYLKALAKKYGIEHSDGFEEKVKKEFLESPILGCLGKKIHFIMGDAYPDNFVIRQRKDDEENVRYKEENEVMDIADITKMVVIIDLHQARVGPTASDLGDLLFHPVALIKDHERIKALLDYFENSGIYSKIKNDIIPKATDFLADIRNFSLYRMTRAAYHDSINSVAYIKSFNETLKDSNLVMLRAIRELSERIAEKALKNENKK